MKFENSPALDDHAIEQREAPPLLVDAYEIKRRTDDLEMRIEKGRYEEASNKKSFAERALAAFKKRGESALRIAMLTAMLGIGDSAPARAEEWLSTKKSASQEIKGSYAERSLGEDIALAAKESGFVADMQIASPNGRYIVHIGQTHYIHGSENRIDSARRVADSQKSIEKVLRAFAKGGVTNVFCEGYVDGPERKFTKEFEKMNWDKARSIEAEPGCFEKLAKLCHENTKWYGTNYTCDRLVLTIKHIFKQRAYELKSELEGGGRLSETEMAAFESSLKEFAPSGSLEKLGDDALYLIGADIKLEEERLVQIVPAETVAGNEGAFKYMPLREETAKKYFNANVTVTNLAEVRELADKYKTAKELDDKATFTDREDIAVSKIAAYAQTHQKETLFPIVFGSAHDFKDNVETLNSTNKIQFGLIKLYRPKESQ